MENEIKEDQINIRVSKKFKDKLNFYCARKKINVSKYLVDLIEKDFELNGLIFNRSNKINFKELETY